MDEYEIRFTVQHSHSFLPILQKHFDVIELQEVFYAKPHFRLKENDWETKRVVRTQAVYYDDTWFRWVHSVETPFAKWSRCLDKTFLHSVGNYQNPLRENWRHVVVLDGEAKLYTFRESRHLYRLVFEWEYPLDPKVPLDYTKISERLSRYRNIYKMMNAFDAGPYVLNEDLVRKPVTSVGDVPENQTECLWAHKLDGVFGLVFSYLDRVKEKWEDYECVTRKNETLGNGVVFAAEKLTNDDGTTTVVLLDVYQVRGHSTAAWCRRDILTQYLPKVRPIPGYDIQKYVGSPSELSKSTTVYKTDGRIAHDVASDTIYKCKNNHSIDLVYHEGYFWLPDGRIPCSENLEDGCVYELSTRDGRVMRQRKDRFKGNSAKQLENIMKLGWNGPVVQPLPSERYTKKKGGKK